MDFYEYQRHARATAIYPRQGENLYYPVLGLAGEAGEIAGEVSKIDRDDGGELTEERRQELIPEIGDCLWFLSAMCDELGITLQEAAEINVAKLRSRADRGLISGKGGNR